VVYPLGREAKGRNVTNVGCLNEDSTEDWYVRPLSPCSSDELTFLSLGRTLRNFQGLVQMKERVEKERQK
jgi:hypothetical protein